MREHTNGKIPTLFDQLNPATIAVLAHALYLKAACHKPFAQHATYELPFTLADGNTTEVPMMTQTALYRYMKGETIQAIALSYKGERVSLYVFVPNDS